MTARIKDRIKAYIIIIMTISMVSIGDGIRYCYEERQTTQNRSIEQSEIVEQTYEMHKRIKKEKQKAKAADKKLYEYWNKKDKKNK